MTARTPLCWRTLTVQFGEDPEDDRKEVERTFGTPCIGSRCAAWKANHYVETQKPTGTGRCALAMGTLNFPDPALPEEPKP